MNQRPLLDTVFWTVSELTHYLRDILESDPSLNDLWVQGEISNLSRPSSGHIYFTLKDSSCSLRCVMWRNAVARQTFSPRDGQAIEVHGSLNIYEAAGQYQLYADLLRPAGEGALYQEFMSLKARLEEEGLFSPEYKRSIPVSPRRIGIVTSPTGAALRDMLNTLQRRYPLAEVILAPTPVQGDDAPSKIVAAIQDLNRLALPDVILIARGGGSIEDLWSFNDESVARAIAASEAPVISGIGHETDFTIADFVSDLRAPTPTAAAELATPNRTDLIIALSDLSSHMSHAVQNDLATRRRELENQTYRLDQRSPLALVRSGRQRLDELERLAVLALKHHIQVERTRLAGQAARLTALNPSAVLQRGFSIVTQMDGSLVNSTDQVYPGDMLNIIVQDGKFNAQVQDTSPNNQ